MENTNRSRIIQAAFELFDTRGYRSVTIKDLADKLGMSKKTIYQYFDSKEEIAAAVVEDKIKNLDQVINVAEIPKSNPLPYLKAILMQLKDESMKFGPMFLMDMEKYLPDLAKKYTEFRNGKKKYLQQLLIDAQNMGLIRDVPIPLITEILSVATKALVKSEMYSKHRYTADETVQLFLDIFFRGLATKEAVEKEPKL